MKPSSRGPVAMLLGFNMTAAVASAVVRLFVAYKLTDGLPGTVLADLATVDASTTGIKYVATSFTPTAGVRYFLGAVAQGSTRGVCDAPPLLQPAAL